MSSLLYFATDEAACESYKVTVSAAAERLHMSVRECNVHDEPEFVNQYDVPHVPAVAVEGYPGTLVTGVLSTDELVSRLLKKTRQQPGITTTVHPHSAWDQIRGWWRSRRT